MFYPDGRSLGQRTIPVESQSKDLQFNKYRENSRWAIDGVTFATLHIVGSNDNLGRRLKWMPSSRTQSCEHYMDARCLCGGESCW